MNIFKDYLKSLKTFKISEITESTYRNKLQDLLETIAKEINPKIKIIHEPKREGRFGSPDYKVTITDNIIGYIENKPIGEDLDKVLRSEQIEKYKSLSDNIIITNYIEFIWLKDRNVTKRESLSYLTDFEEKKVGLDSNREQAVKELIKNFFSRAPKGISNTKKLAEALSIRARILKDFLNKELKRQEEEHREGKLYGLYETFKKYVFNELSIEEFSDTFAQNLVYGLFLAKLNADTDLVNLYNAKKYISSSFELIKELVGFLDELDKDEYKETRWIVEEVLTVMNSLELKSISKALSFRKIKESEELLIKDPYVYFYEDFLYSYDKKLKKSKGIYYTPPPVVNFIIRAIDYILQNSFKISGGLINYNKVTVLDFATGTGTFLLEILKLIFKKLPEGSGKKDLIIKEHILKNLFGFEYLIAPYTIAHLKLSQFLKDNNYSLRNDERFQIFLTNTLESVGKQLEIPLLPALSDETKKARKIKEEPILVITGNPPYSGHSKNTGEWITDKIKDYYYINGKPLGEKNTKWLQDDYVKFFRFAQYKMETVNEGVVGIITNHSFLDNPTFKGMRKSLMGTFNQMYFLDLHGNKKKREKTPDGKEDGNVFDIEQGVSISILLKNNNLEKKILISDYWGSRNEKYKKCINEDISNIKWQEITPELPHYLFKYQDKNLKNTYDTFYNLKEIFELNSVGIVSGRDSFAIALSKEELLERAKVFTNEDISDSDLYNILNLKKKENWDLYKIRNNIRRITDIDKYLKEIDYRVFDLRYIFYHKDIIERDRFEVMKQMFNENIALLVNRQVRLDSYSHAFITKRISDLHIMETANACPYHFPLYRYNYNKGLLKGIDKEIKSDNLKKEFKLFLVNLYKKNYSPEEILGYIYSILYSPIYRTKYFEFLKRDFPRIPFTRDIKYFEKLSELGKKLIITHLIEETPKYKIGNFMGKGDNRVESLIYEDNKIKINKNQYFNDVSSEIYSFQIGSYKVLYKHLRDRKNKLLNLEEIENIERIIKAIKFTLDQMKIINDLTKDWI